MNRYMVLEGVEGTLVVDPHSTAPHRFVAVDRIALDPKNESTKHARLYAPTIRVHRYHTDLVLAVKRKEVKQHGGFVMAADETDALTKCTEPAVKEWLAKQASAEKAAVAAAEKAKKEAAKAASDAPQAQG